MRCTNCGADIPEGMLICPDCGTEVQIVPDYNPLEDVLTREVKGSVEDVTRPIRSNQAIEFEQARYSRPKYNNSTRVLDASELEQIRENHMRSQKNPNKKQSTGRMRNNVSDERKRQHAARIQKAKKRRRNLLISLFLILILIIGGGIFIYQNSYGGIVNKGQKAFQEGSYSSAERYYKRAIGKDEKRAEAYTGLSKVYIKQDDLEKAEEVFLNAIDAQPENVDLYEALAKFYLEIERPDKISATLDGCSENVLEHMEAYVSDMPEFSLQEGTYSEVQQVTLTGKGDIYYTLDGSEPSIKSTLYSEPILIEEGTVVIKAICVNKKEIPSLVSTKIYQVEIPIEDAPAITPSTGQYTEATQITISVPEGYTAYYTMDNTVPSTASTVYTGPIDMPEGQTIFSAILVNKSGKSTQVTKRNYVLNLQ